MMHFTFVSLLFLAMVLGSGPIQAQPQTMPANPPALGPATQPATPLPRIGVRAGQIVNRQTLGPFHPRGFNYIRLFAQRAWHATFSPDHYDAARAEAMLADLRQRGFTVVRVFINPLPGEGIIDAEHPRQFSARYLANFLDFLSLANRQGIYVIACLCDMPPGPRYHPIAGTQPDNMRGVNFRHLHAGGIKANAQYVADFVAAIKAYDPNLLSTIFAYELDNESHYAAKHPPFSLRAGTVTPANGQTYDLASQEDQQRMADDLTIFWANACVEAIRAVDAEAMVSVNVFTFNAVQRPGAGSHFTDQTWDGRIPLRPLALAKSNISYLDIHTYPFNARTFQKDLASIEFDAVKSICAERGLPMICGEFGAFSSAYPHFPTAVSVMRRHLKTLYQVGFVGDLYWTYDTAEQEYLWHACSENGAILEMLTEFVPPRK